MKPEEQIREMGEVEWAVKGWVYKNPYGQQAADRLKVPRLRNQLGQVQGCIP